MGVLQRFERRLEGMVEGAFAKVFGGVVQPVEVAAALQREAGQNKQIVGRGRVLVPNVYTVEIGPTDLERFAEWDEQLRAELAAMVTEHAADQGWSFVADVQVLFEQVDELDTGMFRVRSGVLAPAALRQDEPPRAGGPAGLPVRPVPGGTGRAAQRAWGGAGPSAPRGDGTAAAGGPDSGSGRNCGAGRESGAGEDGATRIVARPRLVLAATSGLAERTIPLTRPVTVLGRGTEADLRLADTGVSRRHAELALEGGSGLGPVTVRILDLGSTNGTRVNGRQVDDARLRDGDRIDVGGTSLLFRSDA